MNRVSITMLIAMASFSAWAEESKKGLSTDAELGFLSTSGNTESTSIVGKINAKHELTKWRNQYILRTLYKKNEVSNGDDNVNGKETNTTAHENFASVQADYKINEKHRGIFVYGSYEDDRFSGFEYQGTLALGYSDRLFDTPKSHLDYSVGPGLSFDKTEARYDGMGLILDASETNEAFVVRLAGTYLYQISETAKFTQTLSSDIAVNQDDNSKTNTESALTAKILNKLAVKASYTIQYNSVIANNSEHTDTQTTITLVYSF